MASLFTQIPVRLNGGANGNKIYASWWNDIRTALINQFGAGIVAETQFTIADNQGSYQDVTGLVFDHNTVRAFKVEYTMYRTNGTSIERRELGYIVGTYKPIAGAWSYSRVTEGDEDALNVVDGFICNSAGQVQYKSDSVGGTYVGTLRYKVIVSFNKET